jgi:hypothetical protein
MSDIFSLTRRRMPLLLFTNPMPLLLLTKTKEYNFEKYLRTQKKGSRKSISKLKQLGIKTKSKRLKKYLKWRVLTGKKHLVKR